MFGTVPLELDFNFAFSGEWYAAFERTEAPRKGENLRGARPRHKILLSRGILRKRNP